MNLRGITRVSVSFDRYVRRMHGGFWDSDYANLEDVYFCFERMLGTLSRKGMDEFESNDFTDNAEKFRATLNKCERIKMKLK